MNKIENYSQANDRHPQVIAALNIFSLVVGGFITLISGTALIIWALGMPAEKMAMDPLMAMAFLSAALSLLCLTSDSTSKPAVFLRRIGLFFSMAVLLLTGIRIFGSFFYSVMGLDPMLFREKLIGNHIGVHTCLNFIAIALALFLVDFQTSNKIRPTQFLTLCVAAFSMLALLGYAYGVQAFYGKEQLSLKTLNATVLFILLAMAIFSMRPGSGITTLITSSSTGGTLARRLLPACIFLPVLIGMAALYGSRLGFYDKEFLFVIVVVSNVVVFTGLVWWLANVLFAIDTKRKQAEDVVRHSSLTDELTGLYNRRGFQVLAEQQIKVARRDDQACVMFFADMDGLKRINDNFGHKEGDRALRYIADILRTSFRSPDIVARFAGDEFAILCISADPERMNVLKERLENETLIFKNKNAWLPYQLSFSVGESFLEGKNATIEQLMSEADKKLYEIKHQKKKAVVQPFDMHKAKPKKTPTEDQRPTTNDD